MDGTAHQQRRNRWLLDGRIEKRLPVSVPIYLAHLNELRAREQTVTENVSPHGARILTKRFWRTGEEALIQSRGGCSRPQNCGAAVLKRRPISVLPPCFSPSPHLSQPGIRGMKCVRTAS